MHHSTNDAARSFNAPVAANVLIRAHARHYLLAQSHPTSSSSELDVQSLI